MSELSIDFIKIMGAANTYADIILILYEKIVLISALKIRKNKDTKYSNSSFSKFLDQFTENSEIKSERSSYFWPVFRMLHFEHIFKKHFNG